MRGFMMRIFKGVTWEGALAVVMGVVYLLAFALMLWGMFTGVYP